MRVTQGMMTFNALRQTTQSYARLGELNEQLSTQKKISRFSQDPVIATKSLQHRESLAQINQFKRNMGEAHSWLDQSDAALTETTDVLSRVRELAVQAANDTYSEEERNSVAREVHELREHLLTLANTNVNGKYIFNGADTTNKPVTDGDVSINSQTVELELQKGVFIQVNAQAGNLFSQELFDDMQRFIDALGNPEVTSDELSSFLGEVEGYLNSAIDVHAEVGARMSRVDMVENRLAQQEFLLKGRKSENEDIDFEETVMNLLVAETVHSAALASSARIIQPSLLDFLR
ncbi:flagellar hook-associated protein FlgL [Shouchella shacheensis]|uniref:flagellar hook-associated protein FlgL n=1 Tax=Shouchella shacheensis TaxID=1649580 RepID=UPI00073FB6DD|nr:flagellar hook-associated protein FlgL [Shouchella shacheensis]